MKHILFPFFALLLLSSCKDFKEPELRGIDNVRMGKLSLKGSTIEMDIKYYNPNSFKAQLKEAEGDAWMDSSYLGHFTVDTLVHVPASSEFLVPVNLTVDMKHILQHSISGFVNNEVFIKINGTAKAGRHGIYKNIPLRYEGKQDLKKLFDK